MSAEVPLGLVQQNLRALARRSILPITPEYQRMNEISNAELQRQLGNFFDGLANQLPGNPIVLLRTLRPQTSPDAAGRHAAATVLRTALDYLQAPESYIPNLETPPPDIGAQRRTRILAHMQQAGLNMQDIAIQPTLVDGLFALYGPPEIKPVPLDPSHAIDLSADSIYNSFPARRDRMERGEETPFQQRRLFAFARL